MNRLDMGDRAQLADRVDTDLKRGERETGLDFFDGDDRFTITSYSPSIVRSLLKHDEARINWIYASGSAEPTGRVTNPSLLLDTDAAVEGLQATLPKGTLKVKGTVRRRNADGGIVSTPEDAEDVREAFTDGGVIVDASRNDSREYLVLVECPLCGEDWREDLAKGEHYPEDVAEHLREEHGAAVSRGGDQ